MVEVELIKIGHSASLKLYGTIDFILLEDHYQELILAQRITEGSENYYLHYKALRCEISEKAAQDLIALGAKEVDLEDLKNFRI